MLALLTFLAAATSNIETLLPPVPDGPGCVADVRRDGKAVATRATGLANLETPAPNGPETVFEIGSVSKQFIGAGVALLADRGKLGLDDPVRRWLPELPPLYGRVTVRMLLNHTSGIRNWNNLAELTGNGEDGTGHDNQWVLRAVARQSRLNNAPGTEYLYSNSNFVLAAIIIERASGERLNDFFEGALFRRLGMARTHWRTDFRAIVPQRAQAYDRTDGGTWRWDMPLNDVAGAGGLLSTVGDLQRWNAMLSSPGADDARWVRTMQEPGRLSDGTATQYGLGLELQQIDGQTAVSHAGSTASYRAWLGRFPAQGLSVALLCNSGAVNTEDLGPELAGLYLPEAPTKPASPTFADAPAGLAGLYRNIANDVLVTVTSDRYGLHFNGGIGFQTMADGGLRSVDGRRLAAVGRDRRGRTTISLSRPGNAAVMLERTAAWKPSASELRSLAGSYVSPEVDGPQTIAYEDGALAWIDPGQAHHPLRPIYRDAFDAEGTGWTLRFVERPGGPPDMLMSITRARQISFTRSVPDGRGVPAAARR